MTAAIKIRRDKVPQALLVPTRGAVSAVAARAAGGASGTPAEVFVLEQARLRAARRPRGAARPDQVGDCRRPAAGREASRSSVREEIVEP